ncbi:MAG: hypothetical protein Q8Q09_11130 [Deltaproteobacteria bacterium]|nr:hypothetical protein [Deltaproteobacteria bacterium]
MLHSFRQGKHAGHPCEMYAIARTRPAGAKGRPFANQTSTNAAQFQLKPLREGNEVKWLQWVDERLAVAWAQRAAQQLAAIESRFGADDADATWFESVRSEPTAFTTAIQEALQSLIFAHSALDLPTLVDVRYRGKSHPLVQSRVSYNPDALLRVNTVIGGLDAFRPVARAWLDPALSQATARIVGSRELDADQSVVVDVLTRAVIERGTFEHAQQWIARQPANMRGRYAWRGRRPWSLLGYDANDFQFEYESGPALWTQRSAWLDNVRSLKDFAATIAADPWEFVVRCRANIEAYNRKLARDWGGTAGLIHPGTDPRAVEAFFEVVQDLANQKSERELLRSRNEFVSGMRGSSAMVNSIAGAASGGVGALFLSLATEFFAFLTGVIPRDWLAVAETLPPPLPLPFLLDGEETLNRPPAITVPAPPGYQRPAEVVTLAPGVVPSLQLGFARLNQGASIAPVAERLVGTEPPPSLPDAVEPQQSSAPPSLPDAVEPPPPPIELPGRELEASRPQAITTTPPSSPAVSTPVAIGVGIGAVTVGGLLVWALSQGPRRVRR